VVEWRPGESYESLAVRADRLLYEAKRCGRNQVRTEVRAIRRAPRV
jgi:PleD family two-component response regulator